MTKISLIIPAYNEQDYIGDCLDAILKHDDSCIKEIIVIDNNSSDDTYAICQIYAINHPIIKVIQEPLKGLTKARQQGYHHAQGEIVAYVDADTRMQAGWYQKLLIHFEDSSVGFVSGPYSYYDASIGFGIGNRLYWRCCAYMMYLVTGYVGVGGNFAVRKSVLDEIGGFDTTIDFYGEDTNIARRAADVSKAMFDLHLVMPTSSRRFVGQGTIKTVWTYMINFFSEVIIKKPVAVVHKDYR